VKGKSPLPSGERVRVRGIFKRILRTLMTKMSEAK